MNILLVIDYQYDFYHPQGSLYCQGGEKILDKLTAVSKDSAFDLKIFTQDWHPPKHISFASTHKKEPFTKFDDDILWPDHCIAGSIGAQIPQELSNNANILFRKGYKIDVDSYSAFRDKEGRPTGLQRIIQQYDKIYICGIATDVCVAYTIKDIIDFCENIFLIEDLCIGTSQQNHKDAILELKKTAKDIIQSADLEKLKFI